MLPCESAFLNVVCVFISNEWLPDTWWFWHFGAKELPALPPHKLSSEPGAYTIITIERVLWDRPRRRGHPVTFPPCTTLLHSPAVVLCVGAAPWVLPVQIISLLFPRTLAQGNGVWRGPTMPVMMGYRQLPSPSPKGDYKHLDCHFWKVRALCWRGHNGLGQQKFILYLKKNTQKSN